jgi:hypothetical protein
MKQVKSRERKATGSPAVRPFDPLMLDGLGVGIEWPSAAIEEWDAKLA